MHNRQILVASRPAGIPQPENFVLAEAPIRPPEPGEILVRNLFLSVEPAMRGWLADTANYQPPVPLGAVMRAITVAEVIQSRHPDHAPGDTLAGWFGWQEWATETPHAVIRKITQTDLPLSLALGVLGLNGVTAYLALDRIGQPRPGQTVLVSTAAGAVGSAAGQIARLRGCRTVGLTGGPAKVALCRDVFGYDHAIDYRAPGLAAAIAAACPDGVDIYFDNTAGPISDAVMMHLAVHARIVVCGTAAIAQWDPPPHGPLVHRTILTRRARMEGFVAFDHMEAYPQAVEQLAAWVRRGQLAYREDIVEGIEHCPHAIADLYRGDNLGKRIIALR